MDAVRLSLLLLVQAHFCWGQNTMVAPSQPIIVSVGSDVTLSCRVEPVKDLRDMVVEWARHDLTPRYVHVRRDAVDLLKDQNSLYLGRTSLSESRLQQGDMSLSVARVRASDSGTYTCYMPQINVRAEVSLLVDEFLELCPSFTWVWILLGLGLVLFFAAAAALVMRKFKSKRNKSENKNIELGEREIMIKNGDTSYVTQRLYLKESVPELKENLEKTENELRYVTHVINRLTETKDFLMKIKEKPQETMKLLTMNINRERNKLSNIFKKTFEEEKIDKHIKELERQKEECYRTIQETDRQIKTAEDIIMASAQRKWQLEAELKKMQKEMGKKRSQETESEQGTKVHKEKVDVQVDVQVEAQDQPQGAQGETQQEKPCQDFDEIRERI